MNQNLVVSPSPHIRDNATTSGLMRDVIIALVPALGMATYIFGVRALILTLVTVAACVIFEGLFNVIMKTEQTIGDLSAVVTGMLLGFNLPATLPYWMAVVGAFIAIVIIKCLFGGLGRNFANPAIVARIALFIGFAQPMAAYPQPFFYRGGEAVATATPLYLMGHAAETGTYVSLPSLTDMLFGFQGGVLGETCALALILGGIYLIVRKVISPTIPLAFIGTVFVLMALAGQPAVEQILSGGLMLGAIFMATDYVTGPLSEKGKLVFGIGCGLITVAIRLWAGYPEGVSFAILLMNILCPYIDKLTKNKAFGGSYNGK